MSILGTRSSANRKAPSGSGLEEMIKPYREVILRTRTPPPPNALSIRGWEDLVRASDTLGKPILRYETDNGVSMNAFYVLDGPVGYVFVYGSPPENARSSMPSTVGASSGAIPTSGPLAPDPPGAVVLPPETPGVPSSIGTGAALAVKESALRNEATNLVQEVGKGARSDPQVVVAIVEVRRGLLALQSGRLDDAEQNFASARRSLHP